MHEIDCEICVVGGGPAGLAAAVTAARHRRPVLLIDDDHTPGGRIWRRDGARVPSRARRFIAEATRAGVRSVSGTRIVDATSPNELLAQTPDGLARIRTDRLILALGASERFIPFPGWTLPGICGVGGLQALAKGGLDLRGARVLIAGSGPLLLAVAAGLRHKGAQVLGIHEQAPKGHVHRFGLGLVRHPRKLVQAIGLLARLRGVPRHFESWPLRAEGDRRVRRIVMHTPRGESGIEVDWLACGFGLVPNVDVAALLGCVIDGERVVVDDLTHTSVEGVFAVGETIGVAGVDAAIQDGITAGHAACGADRQAQRAARARLHERRFAAALDAAFALRQELGSITTPDTIVCRCEDVSLASTQACSDLRDAKLLARCGMGPCQGRVCGPALRFLRGWTRDRVRPPLLPLTFDEIRALGNPGAPQEMTR